MSAFYQRAIGWKTQMLGPEMGDYALVIQLRSVAHRRRELTSAPRRLSVSVPPDTRPLAEAALVVQPAASGRRRLPLTVPAASTASETGTLPQTG